MQNVCESQRNEHIHACWQRISHSLWLNLEFKRIYRADIFCCLHWVRVVIGWNFGLWEFFSSSSSSFICRFKLQSTSQEAGSMCVRARMYSFDLISRCKNVIGVLFRFVSIFSNHILCILWALSIYMTFGFDKFGRGASYSRAQTLLHAIQYHEKNCIELENSIISTGRQAILFIWFSFILNSFFLLLFTTFRKQNIYKQHTFKSRHTELNTL